jgi:hypothetical protein
MMAAKEHVMDHADFCSALRTIQADYVEMAELKLTPIQARRLWTLPMDVCEAALGTLVAAGFLQQTRRGEYVRRGTPPMRVEVVDPLTWSIVPASAPGGPPAQDGHRVR